MRRGILITARLKSTRLKEKVCLEICGRPMISHLIDRIKRCKEFDEIILCTSPNTQDRPLIEIAENSGIRHHVGHPDDVLLRLTEAANLYQLETIVNVTGDNPLIDYPTLEKLASYHEKNKYDFTKVEGIPIGTYGWALSTKAMEKVIGIKDKEDTEWWAEYFTQTSLFKCGVLKINDPTLKMDVRLTVDTPSDFKLVNNIFEALYKKGHIFPLDTIIKYLRMNPKLLKINKEIQHKIPTPIKLKKKYEKYRV